ncbi:MAG: hypothetical protein ACTFAL_09895 [Candidatus Electronema sp. V4]|uniref:hypothetical protein n=1 Tax=Candidatus Electronema sp. V4 TaxID=3454756 RepID=UPI0040556872
MDVTCYSSNLAIYGTHCTVYPDGSWVRNKIPLNLSGYEMELIVPGDRIKDGDAKLNVKNVPEENIGQLKSIVYCLADLLSFSTNAQVRFCWIEYGNFGMGMGESGSPAKSKIFDTPSCIKDFVEKCWNTYIQLRERRELKVVIEMLVSIDLVNLAVESKLAIIFILLENLKYTYAKDKGYSNTKKKKLELNGLLEEMFNEYGINDDLTNVVKLRNDIIHQGLSDIPFEEQWNILLYCKELVIEYFIRLVGCDGMFDSFEECEGRKIRTSWHPQENPSC